MEGDPHELTASRAELRADCSRCLGLCCVARAFARSADFAIDKGAGTACPHLRRDDACGIHGELRQRGFAGCAAFDCFGAGQHVVHVTFGGGDWRGSAQASRAMFAAFTVLRQLHEARVRNVRMAGSGADELQRVDTGAYRSEVGELLQRVSERARSVVTDRGADRAGAGLVGAGLRRAGLRG